MARQKDKPPKQESDLLELLKLLRRITLLAVATYALVRGMPYFDLAVRLAILWAVLYISSGAVDVVFRQLSYRAARRAGDSGAVANVNQERPETKLPAVAGKAAK